MDKVFEPHTIKELFNDNIDERIYLTKDLLDKVTDLDKLVEMLRVLLNGD